MKRATTLLFAAIVLISGAVVAQDGAAPRTLRALGAVGDGKADDRAAIESGLTQAAGAPIDGEGLTYAVHGNIEVRTDVDFRNATLVQTMEPADVSAYIPSARGGGQISVEPADALSSMTLGLPWLRADGIATYDVDPVLGDAELAAVLPGILLRTLSIQGEESRPVAVRLSNLVIDRGANPASGDPGGAAGIEIRHASPLEIADTEITGDGKGIGLSIVSCSSVRLQRLNIHDMVWAPYAGDDVMEKLSADQIRDHFGWNNFPIYEYRTGLKRFVRVRIREQLVGLRVANSRDVELIDSTFERIQTRIGDELYPLQTDALTLNGGEDIVVRNCHFAKAWEGIDYTGQPGRGFLIEDCTVTDTIGWGFKIAHDKQEGRFVNCTATRAGIAGFLLADKSVDIEIANCRALETGANQYWTRADGSHVMPIAGFFIQGYEGEPTPRQLTLRDCAAINDENPGAIDYGFLCQADNPEKRQIALIDSTATGARLDAIKGFASKGDATAGERAGGANE